MSDGHIGKCKYCAKKDVRMNYYSNRERAREYEKKRNKTLKRKKQKAVYQLRRRNKHRGKCRAEQMVSNAIRDGRIIRRPCVKCGNPKSEAHHPDYRKPLDVIWLCMKHHREEHNVSNPGF